MAADRLAVRVTASCHCGAVTLSVPQAPARVSDCNCSICRRYGVRWAYYAASTVDIDATAGATDGYVWGTGNLRFVRCATCGCLTHWEAARPGVTNKMGINARLFEPAVLAAADVEFLDGAVD